MREKDICRSVTGTDAGQRLTLQSNPGACVISNDSNWLGLPALVDYNALRLEIRKRNTLAGFRLAHASHLKRRESVERILCIKQRRIVIALDEVVW